MKENKEIMIQKKSIDEFIDVTFKWSTKMPHF